MIITTIIIAKRNHFKAQVYNYLGTWTSGSCELVNDALLCLDFPYSARVFDSALKNPNKMKDDNPFLALREFFFGGGSSANSSFVQEGMPGYFNVGKP